MKLPDHQLRPPGYDLELHVVNGNLYAEDKFDWDGTALLDNWESEFPSGINTVV